MNWFNMTYQQERLKQAEEEERIAMFYRNVFFGTEEGKEVLDDILRELSFFSTNNPEDIAQAALSNAGKVILAKCGIWTDENTRSIIDVLGTVQKGGKKK